MDALLTLLQHVHAASPPSKNSGETVTTALIAMSALVSIEGDARVSG